MKYLLILLVVVFFSCTATAPNDMKPLRFMWDTSEPFSRIYIQKSDTLIITTMDSTQYYMTRELVGDDTVRIGVSALELTGRESTIGWWFKVWIENNKFIVGGICHE